MIFGSDHSLESVVHKLLTFTHVSAAQPRRNSTPRLSDPPGLVKDNQVLTERGVSRPLYAAHVEVCACATIRTFIVPPSHVKPFALFLVTPFHSKVGVGACQNIWNTVIYLLMPS
jgi:hypothetical protein